jgi:hypothetical protein
MNICFICFKLIDDKHNKQQCKFDTNARIAAMDNELEEMGIIVHQHTIKYAEDDPGTIIEEAIITLPYPIDYIYIDLNLPQDKVGNNER